MTLGKAKMTLNSQNKETIRNLLKTKREVHIPTNTYINNENRMDLNGMKTGKYHLNIRVGVEM